MPGERPGLARLASHREPDFLADVLIRTDSTPQSVAQATGLGVIKSVGVTVPAHNEEDLLPACLRALRAAAQAVASLPVHVVVVADNCTDRTVQAAIFRGASVISVSAQAVGTARAAGMKELLRHFSDVERRDLWLATTDADTIVPPTWLERQLRHADQGWDAVLGTVSVADWTDVPAHLPATFAAHYEFGEGPHPHVHGANLGIRASRTPGRAVSSHLATAEITLSSARSRSPVTPYFGPPTSR